MGARLAGRIVRFGLDVMSPVLHPVFRVLEKSYDFFFAPADLRMSWEAEKKFGGEISEKLAFLFNDYRGRLYADDTVTHPRPFDYAIAIVTADRLAFRFIRGRGELTVQITPD